MPARFCTRPQRPISDYIAGIVGAFSLAVLLLGATSNTLAAADCTDPQTQRDMTNCAAQEFTYADQDLNDTYQIAINDWLGGRQTENGHALLTAQRAWLAYRDAQCTAEAAMFQGGSMQPMVFHLCLTNLTRARTETIRRYSEPY
jgi:uncharacterized protein YecT (DUF1311 family)